MQPPDLNEATKKLKSAHRSGNPDKIADALALHANALIQAGNLERASDELFEAAKIHRDRGRVYDEAKCTQLSATLCRFSGRIEAAKTRAENAARLIGRGNPVYISCATELGEIALVEKAPERAVACYKDALSEGKQIGMIPAAQAALYRKLAESYGLLNNFREAGKMLDAAYVCYMQSEMENEACRTLVEKATIIYQSGDVDAFQAAFQQATQVAEDTTNFLALGDLAMLIGAFFLDSGDAKNARNSLEKARSFALKATDPTLYISAAFAIAELADKCQDRLGAYESLAKGLVTLGDLIGNEAAQEVFAPKLSEYKVRWGESVFQKIKKKYETSRRQAR